MSHGKETPRQKMIGMMYLVLMAMLALNVSKEVLNAFTVIDEGLVKTLSNIETTNDKILRDFDFQYQLNENKVRPWKDKADEVTKKADSIVNYIFNKKIEIVQMAKEAEAIVENEGEKEVSVANINSKDNTDAPGVIMVAEEANNAAKVLRTMINEYEEFLLNEIVTKSNAEGHRNAIKKSLETHDHHLKDGTVEPWELANFAHLPMAGVISIMSGLQVNIRNAQSEALRYLYQQIDAGSMKFNAIEATIIPNSNYIIRGNDYSAQIFLAARDTTAPPKIFYAQGEQPYDSIIDLETGNVDYIKNTSLSYDSLEVGSSGKGIYVEPGTGTGQKAWGGIIELTGPDGNKIRRPFKHHYTVAEGSVVVSPTKMNVFYLGVENPVDVSVAGVPPDKVSITVTNATPVKTRNGYIIKPKRPGNSIVLVYTVDANGNKRQVGKKEFRVKIVPDPVAKVNGQRSGSINKNVLLAQIGVAAEMENFDFDLTFRVTEFTVSTVIGGFLQEKTSRSNRFTQEQKALIQRINRGQVVYIQDIKAVGPDGRTRDLGTLRFKLN